MKGSIGLAITLGCIDLMCIGLHWLDVECMDIALVTICFGCFSIALDVSEVNHLLALTEHTSSFGRVHSELSGFRTTAEHP